MKWFSDIIASYGQHCAMHTAWNHNISELDVAEADDIAYEAADEAGELRHWYDADTNAYVETTYGADYLNELD